MPSNPETFYLSVSEYRRLTTVPNLIGSSEEKKLTDEEVESLLLETMALIDAYVGDGWTPFDDDQEFIFPRCQDEDDDGASFIPRPVSIATRMIADAILLQRRKGVLPHQVASESNLGHSYSKHGKTVDEEEGFEVITPSAKGMLQKYRRVGGQLGIAPDYGTTALQ